MRKRSEKEIKNILYELHESEFIDVKIMNNDLIFRVAINCAISSKLGIECELGEKYYLYDIICHNYEELDTDYDWESDLLLSEILCFIIKEDKYIFLLNLDFHDVMNFTFDCESIEWAPLKLISGDYLDSEEIENWRFK